MKPNLNPVHIESLKLLNAKKNEDRDEMESFLGRQLAELEVLIHNSVGALKRQEDFVQEIKENTFKALGAYENTAQSLVTYYQSKLPTEKKNEKPKPEIKVADLDPPSEPVPAEKS